MRAGVAASLRRGERASRHRPCHRRRASQLARVCDSRKEAHPMAIRLNSALATGLLAVAALTLGCSERHTPLAGVLGGGSGSPASPGARYSGRATGLAGTVLTLSPLLLAAAGPLPPA